MILKLIRPVLFVALVLALTTGSGTLGVVLAATLILIGETK